MSQITSQLIYTKGFHACKTLAEAKNRTLTLYRRSIRLIPWLVDTYQLDDISKPQMMKIMRGNIERHKDVKDVDTLSVLIFKGEHSFQEAAMLWKTRYPSIVFIFIVLSIIFLKFHQLLQLHYVVSLV